MDELSKRRMEEARVLQRRPRVSALQAKIDAGEREAIGELESRITVDCCVLSSAGKEDLARAAWGWLQARIEDVEHAGEYAERADEGSEAPARWEGLRVRVTHIAGAGITRPFQVVGRLASATGRGLHVLTDDIEEGGWHGSSEAGDIVRRVKGERFVTWVSLLTVQPLPVREVFAIEANVRAHEEAVIDEEESGDPPEA